MSSTISDPFHFFSHLGEKIQLPPVVFIVRRCWKNSVVLLWLFRENCNFDNFLQFLLRRANYLSEQTNELKYERLYVKTWIWKNCFKGNCTFFFFNILEMCISFFVDFIVFVVLECCREFFNKIYRKFHGPRHVRGLVFRFRTHHPGTLSSASYDFPVSHLETEI